ncbi:MBL fold metallo-hydrolase [Spiroplasma sp. BIUS-1]|uniref:MBL fold metallo-hydrolase n=1 Tax=Spiroplasma sp. BIUS-1 TaxID=216964 RepID=UPI0013981ED5|nr:MBL fold metallo-hydrolase [Spiroplasma sp. BIUS-1]QHX36666.1 hydroxyacylglutathione hydrolase [Spiroplasma sp. BIUS-1]
MIQVFTCNDFKRVNAFLVHNADKKAILIDTGYLAYKDIIEFVEKEGIQITDIFITHGHFPHFYGLNEICKSQKNPNVFIGKEDLLNLFDPEKNMSDFFEGVEKCVIQPIKNLKVISEDTNVIINGYNVNIFKKGAHTDGSLMIAIPERKFIFLGDYIIKDETYLIDKIMQLSSESEEKAKEIFNWLINDFDKNYSVFTGHYEYGFQIRNILEDDEAKLLRKYIEKN